MSSATKQRYCVPCSCTGCKKSDSVSEQLEVWNSFKEETGVTSERVDVFISLETWEEDWAKAKSRNDEPFRSQFEQIRQVVCTALAKAKIQAACLKYTVAKPDSDFWDDGKQIGHRYTWSYGELEDLELALKACYNRTDRTLRPLVVVKDHKNALMHNLKLTPSRSILTIEYPRVKASDPAIIQHKGSNKEGFFSAWLDVTPRVKLTVRTTTRRTGSNQKTSRPKMEEMSDVFEEEEEVGENHGRREESDDSSSTREGTDDGSSARRGETEDRSREASEETEHNNASEEEMDNISSARRDVVEETRVRKEETDVKSSVGKKRKRQEKTDDYLSFVERTMAAYKKL